MHQRNLFLLGVGLALCGMSRQQLGYRLPNGSRVLCLLIIYLFSSYLFTLFIYPCLKGQSQLSISLELR